jgi:hypothetical protein
MLALGDSFLSIAIPYPSAKRRLAIKAWQSNSNDDDEHPDQACFIERE